MLLDGDREKEIDHVYDVYLNENGTILGDKQFDLDTSDLVNGFCKWSKKGKGTPGLYELIFKRISDDTLHRE